MSKRIRVLVFIAIGSIQPLLAEAVPVDVDGDGEVGPHEVIDLAENWKGLALTSSGLQPWQIDGATIFYNTGKVGIGSATPHHLLRISGGPVWTSNGWTGSLELDNGAAIGWQSNGSKRFGIGQSTGGLYFFNTDSDPGTATSEAQYAMTINDAGTVHIPGSVGIGGDISLQGARFQVNDGRIRLRESATPERWDLFFNSPDQKFYLQENAAFNHLVFTKGPDSSVGIGTDSPIANAKVHVLNTKLNGFGVYSEVNGSASYGVYGKTNIGYGVYGIADSGYAVYGVTPGGIGVAGRSNINYGVEGTSIDSWGVSGVSTNSIGVSGSSLNGIGVDGFSSTGIAVRGEAGAGSFAAIYGEGGSSGWAGFFSGPVSIDGGNLYVSGEIVEGKSTFRIDHPLDPANKTLSHSSVDSPDMKNIYDGTVVTDAQGYATVILPDYFEALNKDFRYQLTVIGQFAQAIVEKKIQDNRFTIRTDKPNVEVSWLVTGIRQDPYAKAHPMEVEKVKLEKDRGKYLTPEVHGQPKEMGIHYRPENKLSSGTVSKGD